MIDFDCRRFTGKPTRRRRTWLDSHLCKLGQESKTASLAKRTRLMRRLWTGMRTGPILYDGWLGADSNAQWIFILQYCSLVNCLPLLARHLASRRRLGGGIQHSPKINLGNDLFDGPFLHHGLCALQAVNLLPSNNQQYKNIGRAPLAFAFCALPINTLFGWRQAYCQGCVLASQAFPVPVGDKATLMSWCCPIKCVNWEGFLSIESSRHFVEAQIQFSRFCWSSDMIIEILWKLRHDARDFVEAQK